MPNSKKKATNKSLASPEETQQETLILAQPYTEGAVDDYIDGLRVINLTLQGRQHDMLQDIMTAIATTLSVDRSVKPPNAYSVEQLQTTLEQYINFMTDEDALQVLIEDYKRYLESNIAELQSRLMDPNSARIEAQINQQIENIKETITTKIHSLFDIQTAKQDLIASMANLKIHLTILAKSLNKTIVILSKQTSGSIPKIELICNAEAGEMPIFVDYFQDSMSRIIHYRPLFINPGYNPKEILANLQKSQAQAKEMQVQKELANKLQQEKTKAFLEAERANIEEVSRKLKESEEISRQQEASIQAKTAAILRRFEEQRKQAEDLMRSMDPDDVSAIMMRIKQEKEQALKNLQDAATSEEKLAIERILEQHQGTAKGTKVKPKGHDLGSKTKKSHAPYLQIKKIGSLANKAVPYLEISDPDIKKIAKYIKIKPNASHQNIIGEIKNTVPLPTVVPNTEIASDTVLASITADSITCPIIDTASGRLSTIQQQIFVDFLGSQAAGSIEYQPTVIEANDFDPEDLRSIIKLLSKKDPKLFVKLQLPPFTETKDANGFRYQQHVYDDLKYYIDRYNEQSKMVKIFEHTKEIAVEMEKNRVIPDDSRLISSNSLADPPENSKGKIQNTLKFCLVEKNTISAAQDFLDKLESKPLIMNMANSYAVGGGVEVGSISQEESILRCSNYHVSLYKNAVPMSHNSTRLRYNIPTKNGNLKSIPHDAAYYTGNITVLRDGKTYEELSPKDYFKIDAVAIAGYNLGSYGLEESSSITHTKDDQDLLEAFQQDVKDENPDYDNLKKLFIEKTTKKIMLMLQIAYDTKAENLVLGAISCGAFKLNIDGLSDDWTAKAVKQAYISAFTQAKEGGLLSHIKNIAFAVMPSAVKDAISDVNIKIFGDLAKELQKTINPRDPDRRVRFK